MIKSKTGIFLLDAPHRLRADEPDRRRATGEAWAQELADHDGASRRYSSRAIKGGDSRNFGAAAGINSFSGNPGTSLFGFDRLRSATPLPEHHEPVAENPVPGITASIFLSKHLIPTVFM